MKKTFKTKQEWIELVKMTLKQKKVADKLFEKYLDEFEKYEMMLSNFNLWCLSDKKLKELLGFIPHIWNDGIDIVKKKSEIFFTYTIYKSEEDFQNDNYQQITLPLSTIEKYIKIRRTI